MLIRAHAADPPPGDDTVADVIERLLCEFEEQLDSDVIFRVALGCRAELTSCPHSALSERMRRLAHRRLTAAVAAAGSRSHPSSDRGTLPDSALRRITS